MKNQPVIIEVTRSEGDNEISFSLRGSIEWMNANDALINFTLGAITAGIWENADEAERQELIDAVNALRNCQSYEGKFTNIHIANQEAKK